MPQSDTRDFHEASVNRAIDYINEHLSERIKLDDRAAQGHFSPCHFHRVFRTIVGETHQAHFAQAFKAHFGITPRAWRGRSDQRSISRETCRSRARR